MNGYMAPPVQGIGESEVYLKFQDQVATCAKVDRPVLIVGERGTGKEVAARRIHYMSQRWDGPLVTVNCASLPQNLIESELFGVEKGAYTGAVASRKGRFEEAEGGTLFLDEIGLVPMSVQEKLLRVVEYGTYERLGSSETKVADVRIVGATNADLQKLAFEGKFKEDLLDRLSFDVLFVPPLRYRGDDILLLANNFAVRMATELGREDIPIFSEEVERKLLSYNWPGNVRELENIVERAITVCEGRMIYSENLMIKSDARINSTLKERIEADERKIIEDTLFKNNDDRKKTMEELGLSRTVFYEKLKKYEISR